MTDLNVLKSSKQCAGAENIFSARQYYVEIHAPNCEYVCFNCVSPAYLPKHWHTVVCVMHLAFAAILALKQQQSRLAHWKER